MTIDHVQQHLRLRVRRMTAAAERVMSVEFEAADGETLPPWTPGSHVDLHLPGGPVRQYSLCGDPEDHQVWRIGVLREATSRGGSAFIHEQLCVGDLIDAVGPRNNFPLAAASEYLFIAGGIGITPLLPMIRQVAATDASWSLAYGGRDRASMAFVPEVGAYGSAVTIQPQDDYGVLDLEALLGTPSSHTQVYCCGPEPLLAAVEQHCAAWPEGSLHVERFTASTQPRTTLSGDDEFRVVLQRSGRTIVVPPGSSVLEALEDAGVEVSHSCREGICGTCETKVVDGIPEHRDDLLSDDEKTSNQTMMICVGRALSSELVLDL